MLIHLLMLVILSGSTCSGIFPTGLKSHPLSCSDLMISGLGSWYSAEEPGWFRVSFTVEKDELHVGLERLIETLRTVEAEGWK